MKPFLKFLAIFTTIILLSSLLAPILFKFLPFKFEKIFNRAVIVLSLTAIAIFVRLRRQTFINYGMDWKRESLKVFFITFFLGFMTLSSVNALKIIMGLASWNPHSFTVFQWSEKLLISFLAAIIIAIIEEFFFRGFIYNFLKKSLAGNIVASVLLTSLFYSIVHFVGEKRPFIGPEPTFFDSLRLAVSPIAGLSAWPEFWPAAVGLFIFGIVLNFLVIRTGSLYSSMGLHAGCVFFVKLDGSFVDFLNNQSLFWGSSKAYDGVVGWVALILLGLCLNKFFRVYEKSIA